MTSPVIPVRCGAADASWDVVEPRLESLEIGMSDLLEVEVTAAALTYRPVRVEAWADDDDDAAAVGVLAVLL